MAWSAPMTAVAGAFTAAQWNTYVRDNLEETAPAIATAGPAMFVADAANSIAVRQIKTASIQDEGTRNSSSYGDLSPSGPSVTLTTGTTVIVMISCRIGNSNVNSASQCSYAISGATSSPASTEWAIISDGLGAAAAGDNTRTIAVAHARTVTAGSNTFTMKYANTSGTGRYSHRTITVWSF